MCLLVLAWRAHPRYRLVLAANRDEFHARPAAPLALWNGAPAILAGRDLSAGGTWLGFDRRRRFGVVTNFRDLQARRLQAPSRGSLIPAFLAGERSAAAYLEELEATAQSYAGFNLLLGDGQQLWYASNRAPRFARALPPGVYGLSNYLLDTPWPKLIRVRRKFEEWLRPEPRTGEGGIPAGFQAREEALFEMLADRERSTDPAGAAETAEPATPPGTATSAEAVAPCLPPLPQDWQQILSAPFVLDPQFGTRCSTLALLEPEGALVLRERRFDAAGFLSGESPWRLRAEEWPLDPSA